MVLLDSSPLGFRGLQLRGVEDAVKNDRCLFVS
jgi:hypothetical protein